MPYKAKLTTRTLTTSNVSADNLNKGSELTFQQADSNFLNLRDQSIGIASDDSTTIDIGMGNTLKVAGSGTVTTAVSGQTLTITGTGAASTGDIIFSNNIISSANTNQDIILDTNGTGLVQIDVGSGGGLYVGSSANGGVSDGNVMRLTFADSDINHNGQLTGDFTIYGPQGQELNHKTPFQVKMNTNPYGELLLYSQKWPTSDGTVGQILTTDGAGNLSWSTLGTGLTVVGDDSTGTFFNLNETLKIAGTQNITTAMDNDTLTITGPDLTNLAPKSNTLTIVGDDSTGATLNHSETFKIAGSGSVTTAVSGDTLTINVPSLDILLTVVGDDSTGVSLNRGETLKIAGGTNCDTAVSGDTLTISVSANSTFGYNSIATPTNTPRSITPNFNNGIMQRCVLGNQAADQDVNVNAPTNMAQGDRMYLIIKGDYSGSHNIYIYGMFNYNGVNAINIPDNKFRLFSIYYTGTEYICDVSDELAAGS